MTKCAQLNTLRTGGPFIGSDAVRRGYLTKRQLYSSRFRRLFHNVHISADAPVTHELRCRAVAPTIPPESVITGASAAAIYGVELGSIDDPVEIIVPENAKFVRQHGLDIRRSSIVDGDYLPWKHVNLATPYRMVMDLLTNTRLRPSLPNIVSLLDVLLRSAVVELSKLVEFFANRRVHGIVRARQALKLANPRSATVEESEIRVWLELAGLSPAVQLSIYREENGKAHYLGKAQYLGQAPLAFPQQKIVLYCGDNDKVGKNRERTAMQKAGWKILDVPHDWLTHDPQKIVSAVRTLWTAS